MGHLASCAVPHTSTLPRWLVKPVKCSSVRPGGVNMFKSQGSETAGLGRATSMKVTCHALFYRSSEKTSRNQNFFWISAPAPRGAISRRSWPTSSDGIYFSISFTWNICCDKYKLWPLHTRVFVSQWCLQCLMSWNRLLHMKRLNVHCQRVECPLRWADVLANQQVAWAANKKELLGCLSRGCVWRSSWRTCSQQRTDKTSQTRCTRAERSAIDSFRSSRLTAASASAPAPPGRLQCAHCCTASAQRQW